MIIEDDGGQITEQTPSFLLLQCFHCASLTEMSAFNAHDSSFTINVKD